MTKLIFIGLGLFDGSDISYKGLKTLEKVDKIYAEFYTAKMAENALSKIESLIIKKIEILDRDEVENGELILSQALEKNVAFLCQGDPLTATTHIDLLLQAKQKNIEIQIIHSSSVVTAVPGLLGLQFYKFGRTTTLALPEGDYFPESPYDVILQNKKIGLHTLVLLDIQVNSNERRYMTANEAIELLLKISKKREDSTLNEKTLMCVVARAGSMNPAIAAGSAGELIKQDFGEPLHSLVVPGKLHFKEAEAIMILANAPKELVDELQ
jgi:diphthine synthase